MFYRRDDIYGQFTVEDYVGDNFIPEICLLGEITAKKNRSNKFKKKNMRSQINLSHRAVTL